MQAKGEESEDKQCQQRPMHPNLSQRTMPHGDALQSVPSVKSCGLLASARTRPTHRAVAWALELTTIRAFGSPNQRFRQCALLGCFLICCARPPRSAPSASNGPVAQAFDGASPTNELSGAHAWAPVGDPLPEQNEPQLAQPPETAPAPVSSSSLPIESFEPAVLRWATEQHPAPLFVIAHGAGGMAEWHCQHYAELLGPACTLVCLKGKRKFASDANRGYYFPNHLALAEELLGAHSALLEHHAEQIVTNAAVYVGYSQGASMGVLAVAEHGDWFPRLLLVEGGYENWSGALAKRYASTGGRRVLFVCGTEHCRNLAQLSVFILRRNGVTAELRVAVGAGHRPDGPVTDKVREGLIWLLDESPELALVRAALTAAPERQTGDTYAPSVATPNR